MAENVLAVEKHRAGAAYLAALRTLGLEPKAMFWAKDTVVGEDVLILVTSLFDHAGPLGLSDMLFRAYNLAATPKEIDPFVLRLHSPRHTAIETMARRFGRRIVSPLYLHGTDPTQAMEPVRVTGFSMGADVDGIYTFDLTDRRATLEASRDWRRFRARVERLAA